MDARNDTAVAALNVMKSKEISYLKGYLSLQLVKVGISWRIYKNYLANCHTVKHVYALFPFLTILALKRYTNILPTLRELDA